MSGFYYHAGTPTLILPRDAGEERGKREAYNNAVFE
jgi:hypothetical protein